MKALAVILILTSAGLAKADDYSDRLEAMTRQRFEQMEQWGRERDARNLANSHSAAVAFASKHGGFKVGPEDYPRDGHWAPTVSFTTYDDLACHAWQRCEGLPVSIRCVDGHGNIKEFGPKLCPLPKGFRG